MAKRVLIFSLSYFPLIGGAEVALKEITDRIHPEEIEFDMVTLRFSKSHPNYEKLGNINVHRLGGGLSYLSKILFLPQAAAFAVSGKYDLYWAMMTYMLFPITLTKLLGSKKTYVLTLQDGDPFTHVFDRWRVKFFKPLLTFGFRNATKVQAISNFLASWAKQMGYKGEVAVIPNGVNLEKFSQLKPSSKSSDKIVLVTTSRLVEKNGVGDVIEALKLLPQSVVFQIIGGGPLEKSLKMRVKKLKLEERVKFIGEVKPIKIPEYLHSADFFVRPSLSEGMGNSFIEAMAAGLPVIGTQVGGIKDFLVDGETGMVCLPNDPQSIADAINKIIDNPALREKLITNGKNLVKEKYSWDLIAEEMKSKVFR